MGPEMKRYYGGWHYLIWDNGSKKGQRNHHAFLFWKEPKMFMETNVFFLKTGTVP